MYGFISFILLICGLLSTNEKIVIAAAIFAVASSIVYVGDKLTNIKINVTNLGDV